MRSNNSIMPSNNFIPQIKKYNSRYVTDIDLHLTMNAVNNDVNILVDAAAIKESVKYLVLSNTLDFPYTPEVACNISRSLFDNVAAYANSEHYKDVITAVLNANEPNIIVNLVAVAVDYTNATIAITINYTVTFLNIISNAIVSISAA